MAEKEYMLECRGMNFKEYCELEELQRKYQKEHPNDASGGLGYVNMKYVMEKIYPDAPIERMTIADASAVFARTMELSGIIHEDEIKNLKPASAGSTNEQATAKTAAN